MQVKRRVGINLISFHNSKSVGDFVFMKRIFKELWKSNLDEFHFVIYIQKNLVNALDFPENISIEIVKIPVLKNAIFRILFEQSLFYFYLRKTDVLFSPSLSMPLFAKPYKILTIHDMVPFVLQNKYNYFRQQYIKKMLLISIYCSDRIVTVSDNSKNDIMKYAKTKENKISVINNFIPSDEVVIQKPLIADNHILIDSVRRELKTPYFLSVSTLQPAKNIDGLMMAFDEFANKRPEYSLYIVGHKGWGYNFLFKIWEKLKNRDKVIFTGYIDDKQLSVMYDKCVGVVYLSFYEGFGIPPLEGFYHNKSCIASDISSLPEVVGEAGIMVDPYDSNAIVNALSDFADNPSKYESEIAGRIQKFSPRIQIEKFIQILLS